MTPEEYRLRMVIASLLAADGHVRGCSCQCNCRRAAGYAAARGNAERVMRDITTGRRAELAEPEPERREP